MNDTTNDERLIAILRAGKISPVDAGVTTSSFWAEFADEQEARRCVGVFRRACDAMGRGEPVISPPDEDVPTWIVALRGAL